MIKKARSEELGYLFVVGGPGSSGSSTIAKLLAEKFHLNRVYAGDIFRNLVKDRGFNSLEDYYRSVDIDEVCEIDRVVDQRMIEESNKPNVLIESKIFACIAQKKDIPCTIKIWLDASLHVRTLRYLRKMYKRNWLKKIFLYTKVQKDLEMRENLDSKRYLKLYGADYDDHSYYYDIVIDSSHLNVEETINLILKGLYDGGYIKER